jgi:hypothetical protein
MVRGCFRAPTVGSERDRTRRTEHPADRAIRSPVGGVDDDSVTGRTTQGRTGGRKSAPNSATEQRHRITRGSVSDAAPNDMMVPVRSELALLPEKSQVAATRDPNSPSGAALRKVIAIASGRTALSHALGGPRRGIFGRSVSDVAASAQCRTPSLRRVQLRVTLGAARCTNTAESARQATGPWVPSEHRDAPPDGLHPRRVATAGRTVSRRPVRTIATRMAQRSATKSALNEARASRLTTAITSPNVPTTHSTRQLSTFLRHPATRCNVAN